MLMPAGWYSGGFRAQTLDSEAWVQIFSLLLTSHVLGEGPSLLAVPQFPHLQMRKTTAPASEVAVRIRLVTCIE